MTNLLGFFVLLCGLPATLSQTYSRCVAEERIFLSTSYSTFYEAEDICKAMNMRLVEIVNNNMILELQMLVQKMEYKGLNIRDSVTVWAGKC